MSADITPNYDEVICPQCCHQFRAIPVNVQSELSAMTQAVGLASTIKGEMPMRPDDPIGMMQEVVAFVAALREQLASLKAPVDVAKAIVELQLRSCGCSFKAVPIIESLAAQLAEEKYKRQTYAQLYHELGDKMAERDAELAALKEYVERVAVWLEIILQPAPLTFGAKWLAAYRAAYPKEVNK